MNKTIKILLWATIIYLLIIITLLICTIAFKWSWTIFLWIFLTPLVIGGVTFLIYKLTRRQKPKEKIEDEIPDIDIDMQKEFVKAWIKSNTESPVDNPIILDARPYTPKQEGVNKLTVNIIKVKGYWGEPDGFDYCMIATQRKKKEIILYQCYSLNREKEMVADFEQLVDKAVINPMQSVEMEERYQDPVSGQERVIKRRTPLAYIQKAEEEKEKKKIEKEEGAEEE